MSKKAIKEQVKAALDFRQAVRVYSDQTIPKEDVDFILDSAHVSPSSVGLEAWRFVVMEVTKIPEQFKSQLKAVAWGAQYQLDTASHFVFLIAGKDVRYDSEPIRQSLIRRGLDDSEALASRVKLYRSFQENDMQMADSPRALFDWSAKQTYIALGNMMLTASLLGIDSCPIEGFDYAKVDALLEQEGIIDSKKEGIASMLSLGYRLRDPKHPRSRKPRQEVIFWH